MRITHIYHSGFAVELACCTLLFDWYTGELPRLRYDLPLVTLVSHEHSDHYGRCIWSLREQFPNVRYVLDEDVAADAPADARVTAVEPHESYELQLDGMGSLPDAAGATVPLSVETLESNDEGVAFLVRACGTSAFFSGDLNSWQWARPAEQNAASEKFFRTELSRIVPGPVDLAFVPLDPRLEDPAAGIAALMDVVGARALFPMHYWDASAAARALMSDARLAPYLDITHFEDVCELPDPVTPSA